MFGRKDPHRLRVLRGVVLKALYTAAQAEALNPDDPYSMSKDILLLTLENLKSLPNNEDLKGAVRYLEGRGYVRASWLRDGTGWFESVSLLPAGIDLVEETREDPAVVLGRRRT